MSKKVFVIGGGASGMMAAIQAASKGHLVTILEANDKLGKKILITGNGRCNITNANVSWQNYHGTHPKFAASVLAQFSNQDTINFFENLGLLLKQEDDGRLFPRTDQAQSVIDILEEELQRLKVQILFEQKVKSIEVKQKREEEDEKNILIITRGKKKFFADVVIIATGGKSYPKTGSTGDGYTFARSLGHEIIDLFQTSVPFRISHIVCNKLQGIKIEAKLTVWHKDTKISKNTGEVMFTHLGLSAPAVLQSSRDVSEVLQKNPDANISCTLNLFPEFSKEQLRNFLKEKIQKSPQKTIRGQFTGILPEKVSRIFLQQSRIDPAQTCQQLSTKTLSKIVEAFTHFKLPIHDVLGWDSAQFTAGGVDVSEINSKTMESKIVSSLYFCGEVVDIDGDSGGYNLQWAWSSGWVAGSSV